MPNQAHLAMLLENIELWNQWRSNATDIPDLSRVDLSGREFCRANFKGANLENANLRSANLRDSIFAGADLSETDLRGAVLRGADLTDVKGGLRAEQLAGADLTGATLPEPLERLFQSLENVNNISESARKLFVAVLGGCFYCWLTIATTSDASLITNRSSSPLPIIQASVPVVGFYLLAPVVLLCVYFYFHFYLQKLWEELGSLPAIFPDGKPLHAKIDPWLLNDLVRSHLPRLNVNRPFLSYFQLWVSVLLAWWMVPLTIVSFWARYVRTREVDITKFYAVLIAIAMMAAFSLYRLAIATLRGFERRPFKWKIFITERRVYQMAVLAGAVLVLVGLLSRATFRGDPWSGVPKAMQIFGISPFVNLRGAELSQRKSVSNNGTSARNLNSVIGAEIGGIDLRYASARGVFLAGASLVRADLRGGDFEGADLRGANMVNAFLRDANMRNADLCAAKLSGGLEVLNWEGADTANLDLEGADLTYADFRKAKYFWYGRAASGKHWDLAYYDDDIVKQLGLPSDHNLRLAERQKSETEGSGICPEPGTLSQFP